MMRIPQRLTLVAQAVSILREGIQTGVWSRWLAGEHQLCAHLQVSRVTLRAALAQLEREGWVRCRQGCRREIVPGPSIRSRTPKSKVVVLLTPMPLEAMERFALYWTDDLRGRLGEAGYHLEVHKCHGGFSARPESALEELAKRFHPAGWVLYQSAVRVQHWFSEQALPCIITGSRHPGIRLPSVDLDYRAVCRHAGGLLLARGHRCVAFVNPASGLAGDMESEAGFLEAIHEAKGPVVEAFVVNHDGTPEGICRHLDVQLRRTPRFSALLISQPKHVLTVMGYLNRRGLRVPQDVALISRDDESFLQHVLPSVARYSASPKEMAHKLTRLVLDTLRRGAARSRDYRLMPQFIPGESLGASPVPPLASPRKAVARQGVSS